MSARRFTDSFVRTLLFGALAALAWPAWALGLGAAGFEASLSSYLVGVSALYLAGLGATRARALGAALWALGFGAAIVFLARGPADVAIGMALAIAIGRSGLLHARRPGRALVLELLLVGGGLGVAKALATSGLFGISLAIWGFFLVQSLAFLVGGREPRRDVPDGVDPFDAARRHALELLGD